MGNYVLWGKDPETGLNAKQSEKIFIPTRFKKWDHTRHDQSLDELTQSPAFDESAIYPLGATVPYSKPREVFDRKKELARCPEATKPYLLELFDRIDSLDLAIQLWEIKHNKRETIHEYLAPRITESQIEEAKKVCEKWNNFTYLKKRHLLVEWRAEQFELRDTYLETPAHISISAPSLKDKPASVYRNLKPIIDGDIIVMPMGCPQEPTRARLWRPMTKISPNNYSAEDLTFISDYCAGKAFDIKNQGTRRVIDFCSAEQVRAVINVGRRAKYADTIVYSQSVASLYDALDYYVENSELNDIDRAIYKDLLEGLTNGEISKKIKEEYGRNMSESAISTAIARIVKGVVRTAAAHKEVLENLGNSDKFITCPDCGAALLESPTFWCINSRRKNGLSYRCRRCSKVKNAERWERRKVSLK